MAVFPVSSGFPDMSGTYIPTLYAKKLNVELYAATTSAAITSTELEGMIKAHGDKVVVRTLPGLSVRNWAKGQNLDYATPEGSTVELLIDKGKYIAFEVDLLDQKQSDIDFINKWAAHAAETIASGTDGLDQTVLSGVYSGAHARNKGLTAGAKTLGYSFGATGTPLAVTKTSILDLIVDAGSALDEQNCPPQGRKLVLPPWACGLIKKSDLKDASLSGDGQSIMRNGRLGMIDRFEIYSSNNLTITTDTYTCFEAIFCHPAGIAFAQQVTEKDIMRHPTKFGQLFRMLIVFGYKVVKPEMVGHLHIYKG